MPSCSLYIRDINIYLINNIQLMYMYTWLPLFSCLDFPNVVLHLRLNQAEMKNFGQAFAKVY